MLEGYACHPALARSIRPKHCGITYLLQLSLELLPTDYFLCRPSQKCTPPAMTSSPATSTPPPARSFLVPSSASVVMTQYIAPAVNAKARMHRMRETVVKGGLDVGGFIGSCYGNKARSRNYQDPVARWQSTLFCIDKRELATGRRADFSQCRRSIRVVWVGSGTASGSSGCRQTKQTGSNTSPYSQN